MRVFVTAFTKCIIAQFFTSVNPGTLDLVINNKVEGVRDFDSFLKVVREGGAGK